ncbi:MAG: type II toxin-antitoxin system VapB family antitoxin, partial [Candidatus Thorarchaeota archaeon]
PSTPYGEWAELIFSYYDAFTNTKIDDSVQLQVSINEPGVSFTVSFDAIEQEFTVMIDTGTLPGIGTNIIHLNVTWTGVPFYASIDNHPITVIVIARTTQLTHLSFAPTQWGNNVTIEFIYTDLVSGTTSGMTGTLSLDVDSSKYSVIYIGNGHYLVILNTTAYGDAQVYQLNASIIHTNPNYASDVDIFDISILKRSTLIGYDSPDPAAYQANVTFIVTYSDDSTGRGISGAIVTVAGNGTSSLVLNSNYWVTYLGSGQYLIEVNTTALGPPNPYLLSVSVDFIGQPFYLPQSLEVVSWVTTRSTQILITQTPGEVPFLEDVVFRFKYEDYLLGTKIHIDKTDITLSHGPSQTVILPGDYVLSEFATYYEISFDSTILSPTSLVTGHEIQLTIDTGSGIPYYDTRSITTRVTTTERPTQILFPLVVDTPYYDNITIELSYIDFLTGTGIDDATLLITSVNVTTLDYQLIRVGGGLYRILINSSIFGDTGTVFFDVTMSKAGSPFYDTRTTLDVPALIRDVQTSLLAEAPPPGSTAVGVPIEVILTLKDFDHDRPLENADIFTNWTILFGTDFNVTELGNGEYMLTLNSTGLLAERHEFQVWAVLQFYETAVATVSVQPGSSTVEILLPKTVYYADWGELINITFEVREIVFSTPIPGMDATLLWSGTIYPFTDLGNGFYTMLLNTSFEDVSIFNPQITVTKQYYQQRQKSFTLVVSKATGTIIPEISVYNIVIDTSSVFIVYLNDTVSNNPVIGATVTAEWNGTVYPMTPTGVPGYYTESVDVTGFAIGPYLLTIRAVAINHAFLETIIDINVIPIPTTLGLADGATILNVFFGDTLDILVVFNDTYHALLVEDANVTFTLGEITGQLIDHHNGTYSTNIDVSSLAAQSIYLRLRAVKEGYATGIKSIIVTILPIPTQTTVDTTLNSAFFGDSVSFMFYYHDVQHDAPIIGANVIASWDGGPAIVTDLFNGSYLVEVSITLTTPGLYDLVVRFDLTNYTASTMTAKIEIYATPAAILGPTEYDVPVNEEVNILYEVVNQLDNSTITDVIGIAYSPQLGETELVLLPSGLYSLNFNANIPYGTYSFDIDFSTAKYAMAPIHLEVTVRPIEAVIIYAGNLTIDTSPGESFSIILTYFDLDHSVGISGANISVDYQQTNITWFEDYTSEENGIYTLYFQANAGRTFQITIVFQKDDYETEFVTFIIRSDISQAQQIQQVLIVGGGAGLILVAFLIVAYVRVWSIPKQIREMNRMIRALAKGRIPKPPSAPGRQFIAMDIVNEEIDPMKLRKDEYEIAEYPIITTVPEVNELLEELAALTGLGEIEIEAFRADLARMRASERPGFLREVIEQERARRADVLAKPPVGEPAPEEVPLEQRPEELEDLRQRLLKKGMEVDEIDIIIEEAKSLSKADLEALLSSLGIDID